MKELAYKHFGKGKPLIILHGVFGSSDNWVTVGKKLAEHFEVFIPDLRNHGDSFHSDTFSYEVMANDLLDFIHQHKIERPLIIGHSMGGKAAMKFGVLHPDQFDKMVIVDIGPKAYTIRHDKILEALNSIAIDKVKSRQEADELMKSYIQEPAIRQFLLKNLKRKGDGYAWKLNLPVISQHIDKIGEGMEERRYTDKPFLFIRGGKSDYILDQDSISIVSLFPNANIVTIENAGHWVHAERPDEFIEAVMKFL